MKRILVFTILFFGVVFGGKAFALFGGGLPGDVATEPTQILNNIELVKQFGKQMEQYSKQLEQYALQLQQYQDQVKNTLAPSAYIWDQAQQTMGKLSWAIQVVRNYENSSGGLQAYLQQFQDPDYYASSPCFKPGGCTEAQLKALQKEAQSGTYSELLSNYTMVQGIYQAQDQITKDAATLTTLQKNAQSAKGRMQAVQAGNELASEQAEQLLEIRTLLVQQQNALAIQRLHDQNEKAVKDAATAAATQGGPKLLDDKRKISLLPPPPKSTY